VPAWSNENETRKQTEKKENTTCIQQKEQQEPKQIEVCLLDF